MRQEFCYTSVTLKSHVLTCTGERPLACQIEGCYKCIVQHSSRSFHERNHSDDAPNICTDSGRAFFEYGKTAPAFHSSHRHSPIKVPRVSFNSFRKQSTMAMHRRVHSDARPFPCSQGLTELISEISWTSPVQALVH